MVELNNKGQVLLELLLAVTVIALLVGVTAPLVYVSVKSGKDTGDKRVAMGLVQETLTAVRAVASEQWISVFNLSKAVTAYYPTQSLGKWSVATGTEEVITEQAVFERSFIVQNVCRDSSTKAISAVTASSGADTTCSATSTAHDPSTQKVTVTVRWSNDAQSVSVVDYVTRWPNTYCAQTNWLTTSTAGAETCPSTAYVSSTSISASSSIILCSSGC